MVALTPNPTSPAWFQRHVTDIRSAPATSRAPNLEAVDRMEERAVAGADQFHVRSRQLHLIAVTTIPAVALTFSWGAEHTAQAGQARLGIVIVCLLGSLFTWSATKVIAQRYSLYVAEWLHAYAYFEAFGLPLTHRWLCYSREVINGTADGPEWNRLPSVDADDAIERWARARDSTIVYYKWSAWGLYLLFAGVAIVGLLN